MFAALRRDIKAVFERDPAARSVVEVLLCYPGVHALAMHRVAHRFWTARMRLTARFISHVARLLTGIEIHPGAVISPGILIDHGMAVVIGETAEVGEGCTIYQGVTLGGTGTHKGKRHPTIGRNVTLGAGAKVLGAIEVGDNALIGSGAVVLRPVPAEATAVGVPARIIALGGKKVQPLEHGQMPDPVSRQFHAVAERLAELERRLRELEHKKEPVPAERET
jgi:serine O-acetyltransferase